MLGCVVFPELVHKPDPHFNSFERMNEDYTGQAEMKESFLTKAFILNRLN